MFIFYESQKTYVSCWKICKDYASAVSQKYTFENEHPIKTYPYKYFFVCEDLSPPSGGKMEMQDLTSTRDAIRRKRILLTEQVVGWNGNWLLGYGYVLPVYLIHSK